MKIKEGTKQFLNRMSFTIVPFDYPNTVKEKWYHHEFMFHDIRPPVSLNVLMFSIMPFNVNKSTSKIHDLC